MRRSLLLAAIVSLTIFSAAAAPGQSSPSWEKVSSAEGKFEISFPFKPETTQNTFGLGANKMVMTILAAEVPEGAFMVSYMDLNSDVADAAEVLLRIQKSSLGAVDGTLISSSAGSFMGYPARDYKVKVNALADLGMVTSVKAVLVGRRLYQVAVVTSESNLEGPMFTQFISSFRLAEPAAAVRR